MARPGARAARHRGRRRRHQFAARGVEREHVGRVEALVGHDEEALARIEHHVVRTRVRLLGAMRPRLSRQRRQIGDRPERAVGLDRQHGYRARAVIRADHVFVVRIDAEPHAVPALRVLRAERAELACRLVDAKCRDHFAVAVRRIEEALIAVERQPRRIVGRLHQLHLAPGTVGVDAVHSDALAAAVALLGGVAADVGVLRQRPAARHRSAACSSRGSHDARAAGEKFPAVDFHACLPGVIRVRCPRPWRDC